MYEKQFLPLWQSHSHAVTLLSSLLEIFTHNLPNFNTWQITTDSLGRENLIMAEYLEKQGQSHKTRKVKHLV